MFSKYCAHSYTHFAQNVYRICVKLWDFCCSLGFYFLAILRIKLRVLHVLDKQGTSELTPRALKFEDPEVFKNLFIQKQDLKGKSGKPVCRNVFKYMSLSSTKYISCFWTVKYIFFCYIKIISR